MVYELTICQKTVKHYSDGQSFDTEDNLILYFKQDEADDMFSIIEAVISASKFETEYAIRIIEEEKVNEN